MRMEQLRAMGATERANRREVGTGGKESIEQWQGERPSHFVRAWWSSLGGPRAPAQP